MPLAGKQGELSDAITGISGTVIRVATGSEYIDVDMQNADFKGGCPRDHPEQGSVSCLRTSEGQAMFFSSGPAVARSPLSVIVRGQPNHDDALDTSRAPRVEWFEVLK